MTNRVPLGAVSAHALGTAVTAAPATPRLVVDSPEGRAGSADALAQLNNAIGELKALSVQPMLQRAVAALQADDWKTGGEWASKALKRAPDSGFAWYLLGIAHERAGQFVGSLEAYEKALALLPTHAEIANDLGRLAFRMDMKPQAEKLFRHFLRVHPDNAEVISNLACAIRDQKRYDEAVDLLRGAIMDNPASAQLWNTMGTVVSEQGDFQNADIFFSEALRLDPGFFRARYNLGNSRLAMADASGALEACEEALKHVTFGEERQMMLVAKASALLCLGRLGEGWDTYEARLHPEFHDCTHFLFEQPRWEPGMDLRGKSLLVVGEQGLGDEILFANVLPDIIEALGPDGKLTIAVEPRLVPLFQRSFPEARVGAHATYLVAAKTIRYAPFLLNDQDSFELWTPIATLLRQYRRTLQAFPQAPGYMTPDPERVAHWRRVLETAPPGPKVGLLWKSATNKDGRKRFFSAFDDWAPVLQTPGVCFVNLQYGDCTEELALARERLGVEIWTPPGIDLKQDLDDVAALCAAMDLMVGFSNATFNIGAACGVPSWLITNAASWTRLGARHYAWYPQVRTFSSEQYLNWGPIMGAVGDAFASWVAEH